MMQQEIIHGPDSIAQLPTVLRRLGCRRYLLVCDSAFEHLSIKGRFAEVGIPIVTFSEFTPNPLYEDVCKGVKLFNDQQCDVIVAVGGGSTIDIAKCIKLYCKLDPGMNYLMQEYVDSRVPIVAIPTTAGTGSESTRYAVIYYQGAKQSVADDSIIPDFAILEHSVLTSLPLYQKKCTLLDALCQGIESWWSVNSTPESREYSGVAVRMIVESLNDYIFKNTDDAAERIMLAANYAGRAINITQTTAAHAMSYKLTSLYKLPHGHAVAVCLPHIWKYMILHLDRCADLRGENYLLGIFEDISRALGFPDILLTIAWFEKLLVDLELNSPLTNNPEDIRVLSDSVNPVRLKNNPVVLDQDAIETLYSKIVRVG